MPVGDEPWAFPQDASEPELGVLERTAQKVAALDAQARLVLASGSIAGIAAVTIATLGTDALFGVGGLAVAAFTAAVQRAARVTASTEGIKPGRLSTRRLPMR